MDTQQSQTEGETKELLILAATTTPSEQLTTPLPHHGGIGQLSPPALNVMNRGDGEGATPIIPPPTTTTSTGDGGEGVTSHRDGGVGEQAQQQHPTPESLSTVTSLSPLPAAVAAPLGASITPSAIASTATASTPQQQSPQHHLQYNQHNQQYIPTPPSSQHHPVTPSSPSTSSMMLPLSMPGLPMGIPMSLPMTMSMTVPTVPAAVVHPHQHHHPNHPHMPTVGVQMPMQFMQPQSSAGALSWPMPPHSPFVGTGADAGANATMSVTGGSAVDERGTPPHHASSTSTLNLSPPPQPNPNSKKRDIHHITPNPVLSPEESTGTKQTGAAPDVVKQEATDAAPQQQQQPSPQPSTKKRKQFDADIVVDTACTAIRACGGLCHINTVTEMVSKALLGTTRTVVGTGAIDNNVTAAATTATTTPASGSSSNASNQSPPLSELSELERIVTEQLHSPHFSRDAAHEGCYVVSSAPASLVEPLMVVAMRGLEALGGSSGSIVRLDVILAYIVEHGWRQPVNFVGMSTRELVHLTLRTLPRVQQHTDSHGEPSFILLPPASLSSSSSPPSFSDDVTTPQGVGGDHHKRTLVASPPAPSSSSKGSSVILAANTSASLPPPPPPTMSIAQPAALTLLSVLTESTSANTGTSSGASPIVITAGQLGRAISAAAAALDIRPPAGTACSQCGLAASPSWFRGPTIDEWYCQRCGEEWSREHACPVCGLVYEDDAEIDEEDDPTNKMDVVLPPPSPSHPSIAATVTTTTAATTVAPSSSSLLTTQHSPISLAIESSPSNGIGSSSATTPIQAAANKPQQQPSTTGRIDLAPSPWIACDECGRWVMTKCDGITDLSVYDDENPNHLHYSCPLCRGDRDALPRVFFTKQSGPLFRELYLGSGQLPTHYYHHRHQHSQSQSHRHGSLQQQHSNNANKERDGVVEHQNPVASGGHHLGRGGSRSIGSNTNTTSNINHHHSQSHSNSDYEYTSDSSMPPTSTSIAAATPATVTSAKRSRRGSKTAPQKGATATSSSSAFATDPYTTIPPNSSLPSGMVGSPGASQQQHHHQHHDHSPSQSGYSSAGTSRGRRAASTAVVSTAAITSDIDDAMDVVVYEQQHQHHSHTHIHSPSGAASTTAMLTQSSHVTLLQPPADLREELLSQLVRTEKDLMRSFNDKFAQHESGELHQLLGPNNNNNNSNSNNNKGVSERLRQLEKRFVEDVSSLRDLLSGALVSLLDRNAAEFDKQFQRLREEKEEWDRRAAREIIAQLDSYVSLKSDQVLSNAAATTTTTVAASISGGSLSSSSMPTAPPSTAAPSSV